MEEMAIISGVAFGLRDAGRPVISFCVDLTESRGALQIIELNNIEKFLKEWGCRNIDSLEGKPCIVEANSNTIIYKRPFKKLEEE